jgi:hypothetical protein
MKFISSSDNIDNIDNKQINEVLLNKLGRPVLDESERVFAKTITTDMGEGRVQMKYIILTFNNQPYDPYGADSHRESNLRLEYKTVSQQTHNYYVSYLKTKNSLYMTRAQRSFING